MGYYDSVKDSVKDNKDTDSSSKKSGRQKKQTSTGSGGGFGTLKKAAQEESEEKEESGNDDTPIEVLEEGLEQRNTGSASPTGRSQGSSVETSSGNTQTASAAQVSGSGLEEKLDKIIEQNAKMIEILESFGE